MQIQYENKTLNILWIKTLFQEGRKVKLQANSQVNKSKYV